MYLVLTRWQCPKKWAQEGNHSETPGWSQPAYLPLLAFRLLSWYVGAEAPFRALSMVWWEEQLVSQFKIFSIGDLQDNIQTCLVTIHFSAYQYLDRQKALCTLSVCLCRGKISWGFSELIYKYIIITAVFQLIFSAKGKLLLVSVYMPPIMGTALA